MERLMLKLKQVSYVLMRKVILSLAFCIFTLSINGQKINLPQPYDFPKKPINCETAIFFIDDSFLRFSQTSGNDDDYIIILARLGNEEYSRNLNLKRIDSLKKHIANSELFDKVIFAEGEKINGLGVIEIFLKGKLLYRLPLKRRANLDLRTCRTP